MRRGIAPIVLAGIAAVGVLAGWLLLTPQGNQILHQTMATVGDIGDALGIALSLFGQIITMSLMIMTVSFQRIDTLTGFILFIMSILGNIAITIELIHFITWIGEKVKNIVKPT